MSARRWRTHPILVVLWAIGLSSCGGPTPTGPTPNPPDPPVPALTLTCPAGATGISHNNRPAAVTWTAPTAAGGTAPYTVACSPASGSNFAPGTTTVGCQAADAAARAASCSFPVSVSWVPQLALTKFMAFGDSLTAGEVQPAPTLLVVEPQASYPFKLELLLSGRYQDQSVSVANEGYPGLTTDELYGLLRGSLARYNPEVILIWAGANDLLHCRDNPPYPDFDECIEKVALPAIIGGLRDQIEVAKASGVTVMLATHPPERPGTQRGTAAAWVPTLNSRIAALAASESVWLVDLYAGFPADTRTTISWDGLHLTEEGYSLVASLFNDAIRRAFEVPYPPASRPAR